MDAMVRKSLKIDEIESAKKGASIRIYHGKKKNVPYFEGIKKSTLLFPR